MYHVTLISQASLYLTSLEAHYVQVCQPLEELNILRITRSKSY